MLGWMTWGLVAVLTVLCLLALADCAHTPAERVRFAPKPLWLLFLLGAPVFGGLVWTYFGKRPEAARRPR